jgi:hypothetical protein
LKRRRAISNGSFSLIFTEGIVDPVLMFTRICYG